MPCDRALWSSAERRQPLRSLSGLVVVCFSAAGSFSLGAVLTAIGGASLSQSPDEARLFAATPLVFAAQQAAEGTVWLTMAGDHPLLHHVAIAAFLAFAMVVWPAWAPLAMQRLEQDPDRRRVLTALSWFGAAVAAGAAWMLTRSEPAATVVGHSIQYEYAGTDVTILHVLMVVAYIVPTIVPFFLSTSHMARLIGGSLILSVIAAILVERDAFTSVWCFFAAVLSCLIIVAVRRDVASGAPLRGPIAGRE